MEDDLLKVLIEDLLLLAKDDLATVIVVLPTARFGTYLKAALAKYYGSFLAPKIVNWQQMLGHFWDQESEDQIVSPEIAEYLLKSTIKSMNLRNLATFHAHELLQLFNDLENAGGEGYFIDRLRKEILPTLDFAVEHIALLDDRLVEIEALRVQFYHKLQLFNLITKAKWERLAAEAILKKLKSENNLFNKIFIAGLTTVNKVQLELLEEFAQKKNVNILLSRTPILHKLAKFNPLGEIHRAVSVNVHDSNYAKDAEDKREISENNLTKTIVFEFETPFQEVCTIISEIRELILTRTIPPSQIAILLTSEAEYGAYLRENTQNKEFSTNFAVAYAFSDSPLGRLFVAINRVISEELCCESILALMTHPLIISQLKIAGDPKENEPGASTDLNLYLVEAACKIDPPESNETLRGYVDRLLRKASLEFVAECKTAWEELVLALESPKQVNTHWIALLERFLLVFGLDALVELLPKEKSKGLYLSAKLAFQELLEQFMSLQQLWPQQSRFREFLLDFFEQLFKKDIRSVGDPLAGVQVLSLEESRYVPFQFIYVLGCSEGLFPKALPQDVLLNDNLKNLMGLKGWGYLEAMEDTTFALLRHRGSKLSLSYSKAIGGKTVMRSRYLDQLIFEGQVEFKKSEDSLIKTLSNAQFLKLAATKSAQGLLQKKCVNLFSIEHAEFAKKMSVSSLENLLRCPQKFLLQTLAVKARQLPQTDDQRRLGTTLHKILELFFNGGKFWNKSLTLLEYSQSEAKLLQRLQNICDQVLPSHLQKSGVGFHLKYYSWPRFIQSLKLVINQMHLEDKDGYFIAEKNFPLQTEAFCVEISENQSIGIWGRIDLVVETKNWRLLVDFKQRRGASPLDKKFQITSQLPIYAMSQAAENGLKKTILTYFNLLPSEWEFFSFQDGAEDLAKELGIVKTRPSKNRNFEQIHENLLKVIQARLADLRPDGFGYKADPTNCGYCDLAGVCRRDDPRYSRTIWQQKRLESINVKQVSSK